MSKIIEVKISPKGEISIETKGFSGGECRDATRRLEAALGVRASEQLTNEFHAPAQNTQTARQE